MKKITLILLLASFSMSAQQSYDDADELIEDVMDINLVYSRKIRDMDLALSLNAIRLSGSNPDLKDPNIPYVKEELLKLPERDQKKLNKILSFSYFEKVWENQKNRRDKLIEKQKRVKDSINEARSIRTSSKEQPYDVLRRSLLGISQNPNFTVFRNIDYNFANTAFSWHLQEEMRLASKSDTTTEKLVTETYIPKASSKNEYLKVTYYTTIKENIQGLYSSEKVRIINSVEIVGTSNLIIDLFVNYWNDSITIGGTKVGEIANRQFLGDHVSLIRMNGNLCKILISKGNMDVNYETTYGIHKPVTK